MERAEPMESEPKRAKTRGFISFVKSRRLSILEDIGLGIAMVGIAFMMFLTTADVVGRYFFNKPVGGAIEMLDSALGVVVMLSFAASQRAGVHVGIDILEERFKNRPLVRHSIRLVNSAVPLLLFGLVVVSSWDIAMEAYTGHYFRSGVLLLPTAPFLFTVPVGMFLICLRFVAQIGKEVQAIIWARKKLALEEEKVAAYQP